MKTRILMFGWEFPPFNSGGLGVACLGLTRALSAKGNEILFVMPRARNVRSDAVRFVFPSDDAVELREVDSILQPYVTSASYTQSGGLYGSDLFAEVARYASLGSSIALGESFDVIYAHDWLSFGAGMAAKRSTGKPLIAHVHATEFDRCGGGYGINERVYAIEKEGMEAADRVIAVSNLTKEIIVSKYGISENKVLVVHNGIDDTTAPPPREAPSRLRHLKAAGYSIVLFLGRVTLQKGPDYFIRAAKRVSEVNPKVLFLLSGSGDMERPMMELAASLGIADKVLFTGFLQGADCHDVYTMADLFVMPSVSEPFGITPLEAMRLGTPTLISKQSGVSEVVSHALKADFWDVDDMANKILSIVGYPALRDTMTTHARHEAHALDWDRAAQTVDNITRDLISVV